MTKLRLAGLTKRELTDLISLEEQGIFALDESGCLSYFNATAGRMLGLGEADMGRPLSGKVRFAGEGLTFRHPHGSASHIDTLCMGTLAVPRRRRDSLHAFHVSVPILDGGVLLGSMTAVLEISAATRSADIVALVEAVAANSGQAVLVADPRCQALYVNQAGCDLLGFNASTLNALGGMHALLADPHDAQTFLAALRCRAWWLAESDLVRADGRAATLMIQAGGIANLDNEMIAFVGLYGGLTATGRAPAVPAADIYRDVVEHLNSVVVYVDRGGHAQFINEFGQRLLGRRKEDILGQRVLGVLLPEQAAEFLTGDQVDPCALRGTLYDRTGKATELLWSLMPLRDAQGRAAGAVCVGNEQARPAADQHDLQHEKERARVTLQCIGEGVIGVDVTGAIEYLNPVAEQLTGCDSAQARGRPLMDVFAAVDEATGSCIDNPVLPCLNDDACLKSFSDSLLKRQDGRDAVVQYYASPVHDTDGRVEGAVLVFEDVTEKRNIERQMAYQSSHDILTGLINRREFEARVTQVMMWARLEKRDATLFVMDLDQFKVINDTCGHAAGDVLLKQITALLYTCLKGVEGYSLARIGGDEFGLLLRGYSLEMARELAECICRGVEDFRFSWFDKAFEVGISVGVAPIPAQSGNLAEVLSAAESACYLAKEKGRNRSHVYQPDDVALLQRRGEMQWIHRIHHALKEGMFCLYQQKILPLNANKDHGAHSEILLRMIDGHGKILSPGSFISAAERYRLMPAIDRWVIQKAYSALGAQGGSRARRSYAINLSGQSLCEESFLGFVHDMTEQHRVVPANICFEITETAAISNLSHATQFIQSMKERGYRFALDDFGSGLSSFGYLKSLPVDYLKIDGGFVRDMVHNSTNQALVESINHLGHVMGIQTIAEFVEDDATLHRLWEIGVDHVQGYGVARPRPLWQSLRK